MECEIQVSEILLYYHYLLLHASSAFDVYLGKA